jgi:osmotically-inducible protein OsmY
VCCRGGSLLLASGAPSREDLGDAIDDAGIAATIKASCSITEHVCRQDQRRKLQGVVQLSGFATAQSEKTPLEVAQRVRCTRVHSNIAPQPSVARNEAGRQHITGQVKAALMDSADIKIMQINVETRNGVTQLAGFVTSAAMKERAGQVAAGIDGVTRVDNVLLVKPK